MVRQKFTNATREQKQESCTARPRRKATNAHIFRYLQTRNPSRLEENDLRKALEASLEECPDFWPEDTASCSSSDQSNATSASCGGSTDGRSSNIGSCKTQRLYNKSTNRRRYKSSSMQQNHLCNSNHHSQHNQCLNHPTSSHANCTANHHSNQYCPSSSVHNRFKPVVKKNIYKEADFFHDGIMEYIEYELVQNNIIGKKLKTIE